MKLLPASATTKAYMHVHICVLLWGFTAILGRLITLEALALVWWRLLLVIGVLALLPTVHRELRKLPLRLIASYALVGLLVSVHWVLFYGAIKLANVSVGVICMASAPVFMSVIEPLVTKSRFNWRELVLAVAVIPGIVMIVGGMPANMYLGFMIGIAAAALVTVFSAFNKRLAGRASALTVTFIEFSAGFALLTILAFALPHEGNALPLPDTRDFMWLLMLSLGCTLLPFALLLGALRHISAFATQMATNLEAVYAIVLAILVFNEQQEVGSLFYLGVVILLLAVFFHPLFSRRPRKRRHPRFTEQLAAKREVMSATSTPTNDRAE